MKHWKTGLGLAAALVVGSASISGAGNGTVPYKDRINGKIVSQTPQANGTLRLAFETTGKATQLGNFTSNGFLDVAGDNSFTGGNTLTAANGDQIFLTIAGDLAPTSTAGVLSIILDTEFTGGTGRFDGVEGGFHGEGEVTGNTFTGVGEGTITPPGKSKK